MDLESCANAKAQRILVRGYQIVLLPAAAAAAAARAILKKTQSATRLDPAEVDPEVGGDVLRQGLVGVAREDLHAPRLCALVFRFFAPQACRTAGKAVADRQQANGARGRQEEPIRYLVYDYPQPNLSRITKAELWYVAGSQLHYPAEQGQQEAAR